MRLIVFDMDGTLLDSAGAIVSRVKRAFASAGLPEPDEAAIRGNVGLSLPLYMSRVAGIDDPETLDALVQHYREIANTDPAGMMPLFEGAREALDRLRATPDTVLGIATGKGSLGVERAVSQNGLEGYFDTVQTADGHASKPHPGMLQAAMAETGVARESTLMIGDADLDAMMAVAAGVRCIGVTWGMQDGAELEAAGAALLIDSLEALDGAIEQLLGP
jgi:phosphoglycolate phosphatase